MFNCIFLFNSTTLALILTQQFLYIAVIMLLIIGVNWFYSKQHAVTICYLLSLVLSLVYVFWLATGRPPVTPGNYQISGVITQIQTDQPYYHRFTLLEGIQSWSLSWYGKGHQVKLGDCWEFTVKVSQRHSLQNPFRLFQHALALEPSHKATIIEGRQCRASSIIQQLSRWRTLVDTAIAHTDLDIHHKRMIWSLGIGRQDQLSNQQRIVLQRTGTAHLFAISGLHLTTLALMIYSLATSLGWCFPRVYLLISKPKLNGIIASGFAILYSILVGLSLPIQRALLMLLGYTAARLIDRPVASQKT